MAEKKFDVNELSTYGLLKVNQRKLPSDTSLTYPTWTAIENCAVNNCIAARVCPYIASMRNDMKCRVQMKYLKEVEIMVLNNFGNDLQEEDLFRIGMHLVPLYKQLARFKIVEMTISLRDICEFTKSGTTKVNGLFKEIRECIRQIDREWAEIGISRAKTNDIGKNLPDQVIDYYEKMERDALKEQKNLKLVRRNEQTR